MGENSQFVPFSDVCKNLGRKILGRKNLGRKLLGRKNLGRKILGRKILGRKILARKNLGRKNVVLKFQCYQFELDVEVITNAQNRNAEEYT